jgi:hypothetical protein
MKLLLLIMLVILGVAGCDTEAARKESELFENNAIRSVQEAESLVPGVTCLQMMKLAVMQSEAAGAHFKSKGWMAYKEPGHTVVIYQAEQNSKPVEFKWHIENGYVFPVSDIAMETIKNQQVKFP